MTGKLFLTLVLVAASTAATARAQSQPDGADLPSRLAHARALAAAHNLSAAASELEAIRNSTTDDVVRDVTRVMLVGIYLEAADYTKAQSLLDEAYKARSPQKENTTRTYFAAVGQAVNGAREHINRYRSFGINVADKDLPSEAVSDLDNLRALLERVADQARNISREDARSSDAVALLEDVATLRGSLARNNQERAQWQRESADARQRLAASEMGITVSANSTAGSNGETASTNNPSGVASTSSSPPPASGQTSAPTPTASQTNSTENSTQPVETAKQNGAPRSVGSLIEKATQKVSPSYPQAAKNARIAGIVTVYLLIDETGSVVNVQQSIGPELLRQAAADAARRWKFKPTLIDGQPVRVSGFINFNFAL